MTNATAVADQVESELAPLYEDVSNAWWALNILANEENERRRVELETALSDFLADNGRFAAIEAARETADGTRRRRLDLLLNAFLPQQIPTETRTRIIGLEASVDTRFSQHRGDIAGRKVDDNEIRRILRESDDVEERRAAWEASKTVGALVARDVRELARLRNAAAHTLGFRDWFALSVATAEMDEQKLMSTLDEADRATAEPFARWKAISTGASRPVSAAQRRSSAPGTTPTPSSRRSRPRAASTSIRCSRTRISSSSRAGRTTASGSRRATCSPAATSSPATGSASTRSASTSTGPGTCACSRTSCRDQQWMDTMLHELGHATFDTGLDSSLPWLLRDTHLVVTEGIAILMGRLAGDAEWLERVLGVDSSSVASLADGLRRARAAELLVFTRWVLVMTNFERALYADPESDLDATWWELVERYQLVRKPEGRTQAGLGGEDPRGLRARLLPQLPLRADRRLAARRDLERECGGIVDRPAAGKLLGERVFAPGLSVRWDRLIEQATGEPLTAAHFGRDIDAVWAERVVLVSAAS